MIASTMMHTGVACRTKRNQVLLRIITRVAPEFFVVDFKIGPGAARLTSPAIATQHLVAQPFVPLGIELPGCFGRTHLIPPSRRHRSSVGHHGEVCRKSVCWLRANPPQHSLEEFSALFFVGVRSGQEKGFAYAGNTLTFTSCNRFNVFLQVRAYSERKASVFLHPRNLSTWIFVKSAKIG
jgi:hypothetical protein